MRRLLSALLLLIALLASACAEENPPFYADFSALRMLNSDLVGWLVSEEPFVNAPVMYSTDDEYYFRHTCVGYVDGVGTIHLPADASPLWQDDLPCLTASNWGENQPMEFLGLFADEAYLRAHPSMFLLTPEKNYRLDFFAFRCVSREEEVPYFIPKFSSEIAFDSWLRGVMDSAVSTTGIVPEYGEQVLMIATRSDESAKRINELFARMTPIGASDSNARNVAKMEIDDIPTVIQTVDVPGRGPMQYYAQNDPLWYSSIYESRRSDRIRPFGTDGCSPTSAAIIIANLVEPERLPDLLSYMKPNGVRFCRESIGSKFCDFHHFQYQVETPEEFLRYLPMVLGSFACGNNIWDERSRTDGDGSTNKLIYRLAEIFNLKAYNSSSMDELIAALRRGALAMGNTGRSPFSNNGHFIAVVSVDDDYLYLLDSFLRKSYESTDPYHVLEQPSPGLIRVPKEKWHRIELASFVILER